MLSGGGGGNSESQTAYFRIGSDQQIIFVFSAGLGAAYALHCRVVPRYVYSVPVFICHLNGVPHMKFAFLFEIITSVTRYQDARNFQFVAKHFECAGIAVAYRPCRSDAAHKRSQTFVRIVTYVIKILRRVIFVMLGEITVKIG